MFKITFEAKTMKDLQNQVNTLCGTVKDEPKKKSNDNDNQDTPSPASVPRTTVDESPRIDEPAVVTPSPVKAMDAQGSAPIKKEQTSTREVDAFGTPWDKRIHASSKATVRSGAWKKRKGVDADTFASVMDELKKRNEQPAAPVPPIPGVDPKPEPAPQPMMTESPVVEPAPSQYMPTPVPDSNKPAHNIETFKNNFVQVMVQLKNEGHLTVPYIKSLTDHFQVGELWELTADEAKLSELFQNFADFGWITKVD